MQSFTVHIFTLVFKQLINDISLLSMLLVIIIISSICAHPVFGRECFLPGKCMHNGGHYLTQNVSSVEECLIICDRGHICNWSTYDPGNGFCELFQNTCNELDIKKCPLCLNNEKDCVFCKYH